MSTALVVRADNLVPGDRISLGDGPLQIWSIRFDPSRQEIGLAVSRDHKMLYVMLSSTLTVKVKVNFDKLVTMRKALNAGLTGKERAEITEVGFTMLVRAAYRIAKNDPDANIATIRNALNAVIHRQEERDQISPGTYSALARAVRREMGEPQDLRSHRYRKH